MIRTINGKKYIAWCTSHYRIERCNKIKAELREKGLKVRTLDYIREFGNSYARVFIEINEVYENLSRLMDVSKVKKMLKKYEKYVSIKKLSKYSVQVDCSFYQCEIYYELHKAGYKVESLESEPLKTRFSVSL